MGSVPYLRQAGDEHVELYGRPLCNIHWQTPQHVHGGGLSWPRAEQQSQSSVGIKVHNADAVDGDDAVVLPQTAAPHAAGGVDLAHAHAEARYDVSHFDADAGGPLAGAEIDGTEEEQGDAGDHGGGGGGCVA